MKIAIIGITGLVGIQMLKLLENVSNIELIPVASFYSLGKYIEYKGKRINIITIDSVIEQNPRIILMAVNSDISLHWTPQFIKNGIYVIDNSSAFRMNPDIPLIVPEINRELLLNKPLLVANPNCSTAQLVMALYPLHVKYGIKRVIVSTYQSVTGSGYNGINQLYAERNNTESNSIYITDIDLNCIPQCDDLDPVTGYTKEEMKLINETNKILNANIDITATAIRVPVIGGHSESVNIELNSEFEVDDIINMYKNTTGIILLELVTPIQVKNTEAVWIGRLRRDNSKPNCLNMWVVADNLMKGSALNAIQILQVYQKILYQEK